MSRSTSLVFSAKLEEEPVEIDGQEYVLREATGDAAAKWRNATTNAARMVDGKVVGLSNVADADPLLVSMCLFERYTHGGQQKERPVTLLTVRSWPDRIQRTLADRIKDMSGLREEETEEVLTKRLAETQEKLNAIRKQGKPADPTLLSPTSLMDGSMSPANSA